jgi:hypothetical protein
VSVTVEKVDVKEEKQVCYNCGKKGHWFMDCLFGCGKCEGVGHRTIDCQVVKMHTGQVVKEETVRA